MPTKAVFLDRDGVINRKAPAGEYITRWPEIEFLPGSIEAVALLHKSGFKVIVVTNQRGIATGKIKLSDLEDIHARLKATISESNAVLSGVYCCPHDTIDNCVCRKPQPGMLLSAAKVHGLNLSNCWMVGDSPTDIEAGRRAGCRTALISSSGATKGCVARPDVCEGSLRLAVDRILQIEHNDKLHYALQESLDS